MKKFLKFIDLYGQDVHLYINNSEKYKTQIGGFLSMILIAFLCLIFAYNFSQFYFTRNFNVILQTQFKDDFIPKELTNETFATAFHFTTLINQLQSFQNYNISLVDNYEFLTKLNSSDKIKIGLSDCSNTIVFDNMANFISEAELKLAFKSIVGSKAYCPILFDYKKYHLGGDLLYSANMSSIFMNFTVSLCNRTCDPDYLLNLKNSNLYLSMILLDTFPNMTNLESGFSYFIRIFGFFVDFSKDYLITINYQNNRLTTDQGVFFPTPLKNKDFLNIKSITYISTKREKIDGDININVQINMEIMENLYQRNYMKFDALLANTRAYATIIYHIFFMISSLINYKKLNLKLINKFFHLIDQKKSNNYSDKIRNPINMTNHSQEYSTYHIRDRKFQCLHLQSLIKNKLDKEIYNNKMNKINWMNAFFCDKKKKFEIGEELLKFHLDIIVILKQLFDVEKMKKMIYDKDEHKILKLLQNRIVLQEYDSNYNEQFKMDNFLVKIKSKENLENVAKKFSKLIISGKNQKLKTKILKNLKLKLV